MNTFDLIIKIFFIGSQMCNKRNKVLKSFQDRQSSYNVTLGRVRVTTVAVKTQKCILNFTNII